MMERIRAGWKLTHWPLMGADGLPHASLDKVEGKTLFETIEQSGLPDNETYVVWRGERTFVLLNVFPYTSGHLMVLPTRPVESTLDLDTATHTELWETVRAATAAVMKAFSPHGINVGVNLGEAGGGSQPEHLHVHVVPRWNADTNFMTTVAEVRVLPMTLVDSWQRLRDAWPVSQHDASVGD